MKDGSQGRTTVKNWNNVQLPPGIRIPGLFIFRKKVLGYYEEKSSKHKL